MAESFHSDSEVPAGGTDFDDSVALDLGLRFSVLTAGTITHARFRAADHLSGTPRWGLYRQSDQSLLGWQDITSYTIGVWNTIALVTPIPIVTTEAYQAVLWTPNRYVAENGYLVSAITRGNIVAEAQGGRFAVQPGLDYPNNSFSNSCYFIDFVFQAAGGPSGTTPDGLAVPTAVGTPTVALGLSGAPAGLAVPVSLGATAAALGRTAAPTGLAVPAAVGTPATALTLSGAPTGLAIPVALGQPSAGSAGAFPNGLAIPVAVGQPSASLGRVASPAGLAIPVAIGQPSPNLPVATGGRSWPITSTTAGRPIVATTAVRPIVATSGGRRLTA